MGLYRHNLIGATTVDHRKANELIAWAAKQGMHLLQSPVVANGHISIVCYPDGGKEGADISDDGDTRRARLRAELNEKGWQWFEVEYGEVTTRIVVQAGVEL